MHSYFAITFAQTPTLFHITLPLPFSHLFISDNSVTVRISKNYGCNYYWYTFCVFAFDRAKTTKSKTASTKSTYAVSQTLIVFIQSVSHNSQYRKCVIINWFWLFFFARHDRFLILLEYVYMFVNICF